MYEKEAVGLNMGSERRDSTPTHLSISFEHTGTSPSLGDTEPRVSELAWNMFSLGATGQSGLKRDEPRRILREALPITMRGMFGTIGDSFRTDPWSFSL